MAAIDTLFAERAALCETLETIGPDGPTLCDGWLTADLAAHVVARESRPDAAVGIILPGPFARYLERVMSDLKSRGYDYLLGKLRASPPLLHRIGPMVSANIVEYWIHHEDVRRAGGSAPRPPDAEVDAILWASLRFGGRLNARRVRGAGLVLHTPDGETRVLSRTQPRVAITGPPGELVLFMSGRKEAAEVSHDGPPEAVALVLAARFGV